MGEPIAVRRGDGRAALIEAAAESLRSGELVQVKVVAARAGVSHTLIYRHFPDGGKEQLIAEAYGELFMGLMLEDAAAFVEVVTTHGLDVAALREYALMVLSPRREEVRRLRFEALAQAHVNPYLAERIEAVRRELVRVIVGAFSDAGFPLPRERATAIAVLEQGIPLGVSAIGGPTLPRRVREDIADVWAESLVRLLERT
jgi:AcrR family transcriptional regulator